MKRRPEAPDDKAKEPTTSPLCTDPPAWPPAGLESEQAEVALFIIPGPPMPASPVIDVRSANRIRLRDADTPAEAAPPTEAPLDAPLHERSDDTTAPNADPARTDLPLNTAEAFTPAPGIRVIPLQAGGKDDHPLEAFPSELAEADLHVPPIPVEAASDAPAPAMSHAEAVSQTAWSDAVRTLEEEEAATTRWSKVKERLAEWQGEIAAKTAVGWVAGARLGSRAGSRARAWRSGIMTTFGRAHGRVSRVRAGSAALVVTVVSAIVGTLSAVLVSVGRSWSRAVGWLATRRSAVPAARASGSVAVRQLWAGARFRLNSWRSAVAAGMSTWMVVVGRSWYRSKLRLLKWQSAVAASLAVWMMTARRFWLRTRRQSTVWRSAAAPTLASGRSAVRRLGPAVRDRAASWQSAVSAVRLPRPTLGELGIFATTAAAIALVFGIESSRAPSSGTPEIASLAALSARPLDAVADLAPGIADRPAGLLPAASDGRSAADGVVPERSRPAADASEPRRVARTRTVASPARRPSPAPAPDRRAATSRRESAVASAVAPPRSVIRESAPVLATTRPAEPRAENLDPDDPPSPERTAETEAPRRTAVAVSSPPAPAETGPTASDGIAEALKHLQLAYERRDATLAKAVWPSVNERALARAFDDLRSQSVTFDRCRLNVSEGAGEVQCRGVTTYVPRVGDQYQRSESREWTFRMRKGGDGWLITSAAAR